MSKENSLALREELNKNNFISVFGKENYPEEIKQGINNVMQIVAENKSISELYPVELQEIPVSTSIFQDSCVQMEQHFTPHRKLRQALMELDSKLGALDSAKNNHKKAIVKLQELENEILELENIYDSIDRDNVIIDFQTALLISSFTYTTTKGENVQSHTILNDK